MRVKLGPIQSEKTFRTAQIWKVRMLGTQPGGEETASLVGKTGSVGLYQIPLLLERAAL